VWPSRRRPTTAPGISPEAIYEPMASSSMSVVTQPSWQVHPATKPIRRRRRHSTVLLAEPQTGTGEAKCAKLALLGRDMF
jgi:hypothetical protein